MPVLDIDAIDPLTVLCGVERRADAGEASQIVHPEPHLHLTLLRRERAFLFELAGESPGDADVTEVVDDAAEDVPVEGGEGLSWRGIPDAKKPVRRVAHRLVGF